MENLKGLIKIRMFIKFLHTVPAALKRGSTLMVSQQTCCKISSFYSAILVCRNWNLLFFFFFPYRKQNIHQTYHHVLKETPIVEKCIMITIWRLHSSWKMSLPTFDAFSTVWGTGFVAWNLKDNFKQFTVAASKTAVLSLRNIETFYKLTIPNQACCNRSFLGPRR